MERVQPERVARLPLWPLMVMFGLTPLWWALGALYLLWPIFALLLAVVLLTRGRTLAPTGTVLWLILLGIIVVSFTRLDRATSYLTSGLRLGFFFAGFVVWLYVYNLVREHEPWRRVALPLCLFWLSVVGLGWLGVLMPKLWEPSLVQLLLPESISQERFVRALTTLRVTEHNPLSDNPYYRPSAPFPYTNNWGTAFAVLVPFVFAYLSSVRRGAMRVVMLASLPLALVPAFFTLNRGMFLGLGAGLAYLVVRAMLRGHFGIVLGAVGFIASIGVLNIFIPVIDLITNRTSQTKSTSDRLDLYAQTWEAVLRSPFLGYGAPATVDTTNAAEPLGTQGLVWQVMFNYGIPALIIFLSLLVLLAWRLSAATSTAGFWLSAIPVVALVLTPFYAYIDINMAVVMFAIALGLAAVDGPVNRDTTRRELGGVHLQARTPIAVGAAR